MTDPRVPESARRTVATAVALVVVVFMTAVGIGIIWWEAHDAAIAAADAIERVERESAEADFVLCSYANEARTGIRDFLEALYLQDDGAVDPEELSVLALAEERFAIVECPPDPGTLGGN